MAALHLGIGEEPLLEAQELLLSAGGIELVYAGPGQACLVEDEDVVGFGQVFLPEKGQQILLPAFRRVVGKGLRPGSPERKGGGEGGQGAQGAQQEVGYTVGWGCSVFHRQTSAGLVSY